MRGCLPTEGRSYLCCGLVNLVTPSTYDAAPGVAPTWNTATGWTFDATAYLTTGVVPAQATWSMLVQFANGASGAGSYTRGRRL